MAKNRYGTIYKHTCLKAIDTNGIYIGKTIGKPEKRWNSGKGYIKVDKDGNFLNNKMANTILKHGLNNWNNSSIWLHEVIEENIAIDKLAEREIFWIAYYNSYNLGLNSTIGGDGTNDRKYSDSTIEKMKKSALTRAKKLYQYDLNFNLIGEFESISEAIRQLSPLSKTAIKNCIDKPWRHFANSIFMRTLMTSAELTNLMLEHKTQIKIIRKNAAKKINNSNRHDIFVTNKLQNGYVRKTFIKKYIKVVDINTNKEYIFSTKTQCLVKLKMSKKTLAKYLDSGITYKNKLFKTFEEEKLYKFDQWVKK